jgi:hypothetical protein
LYKCKNFNDCLKDHFSPAGLSSSIAPSYPYPDFFFRDERQLEQFEEYIKARGQFALPGELRKHKPLLDACLNYPGEKYPEFQVALTASLKQVPYFSKEVWTRGKLDLLIIDDKQATVLDWKTGKPKEDYAQPKIFSLYVMEMFPHVESVKAGFVWVNGGTTKPVDVSTYHREDKTLMWGEFMPRIKMYEDAHVNNDWPCRPSGLCKRHCPVTSCEHNGSYNQ